RAAGQPRTDHNATGHGAERNDRAPVVRDGVEDLLARGVQNFAFAVLPERDERASVVVYDDDPRPGARGSPRRECEHSEDGSVAIPPLLVVEADPPSGAGGRGRGCRSADRSPSQRLVGVADEVRAGCCKGQLARGEVDTQRSVIPGEMTEVR